MAVERLSRGWLAASAVIALVALLALGASMTFFVSLAGAPDTRMAALPFLGAVLSSIVLMGAVPVFRTRQVPRWAAIVIPVFVGLFSLVAAVAIWFLTMLFACQADGLCRPADTWKTLPAMVATGVLVAAGPGLAALAARPDHRGRWWVVTVVAGVSGLLVAAIAWVEIGLFPLS